MTTPPAPGSSPNRSPRTATKKLPRDPSVEHLRKQAKTLHQSYQRGLVPATQRVAAVFSDKTIKLTDAQHIIAIEYGFPSWPRLAAHVESVTGDSADWTRDEKDNLPKAANEGDLPRLKQLIAQGDYTQHDLDLALARCWGWGDRDALAIEMADLLIESGADPNGEYGGNYGPILLAPCEGHHLTAIRYLLEHGADAQGDPDRQTKYPTGNTPMRMLLGTYVRGRFEKKVASIDLLMEYGATRPPEVDEVAFAIFRDDADELSRLLDADPKQIVKRFKDFPYGNIALEGATYLHQAVEFEARRCVDVLCGRGYNYGIEVNTKSNLIDGLGGQTPIFHAVASNGGGNFPMFRHLIERYGQWIDFSIRARVREYGEPADVAQTVLERAQGAAKNDSGYWKTKDAELAELRKRDRRSAIIAAIKRGDATETIRLMDAHPEEVGPHLWPVAVYETPSLELTVDLLDRGVDPNECSAPRKPLHLAVSKGNVELVKLLLERDADPDVMDGEHITPIELAAGAVSNDKSPNWEVLTKLLRDAGATVTPFTEMLLGNDDAAIAAFEDDPSLLDQTGWQHFPPLVCAARAGRPRVIEKLLALGADPDQTDKLDSTPLWFACQAMTDDPIRQSQLIQHLVDAGADVNRICEEGTTALHFAVWRGHLPIVETLTKAGADGSIQDDQKATPVDWIDRTQQPDNAPRLRELLKTA